MKQRLTGAFLLLLAWYMYHMGIQVPLQQMKAHAPEIREWMKSIVILPGLIGVGLAHLILGENIEGKATCILAIAAIPLLALGFWWWAWFEHQVTFYGYGAHGHAAPLLATPASAPNPPVAVAPPQQVEAAKPPSPQLPVRELHDLFASAGQSGEAQGYMVPGARMMQAWPRLQVTELVRVSVKKGEDLFPSGCSRYRVTVQQGGDVGQFSSNERVLKPYTVNMSYSLNYCLDQSMPSGGYDVRVES